MQAGLIKFMAKLFQLVCLLCQIKLTILIFKNSIFEIRPNMKLYINAT